MTWQRKALVAVEVAAVGLLGALLGLLVAGTRTTGVGPFTAELSLRPSLHGGTQVVIPPLGELDLDTHAGPVHLQVDVVRLREREARELVADPDRLVGLGNEVARDLQDGVRKLVLQAGVVTVVGATALGLLVFRRPRRTAFAGGAGVAAVVLAAGATYATFDRTAVYEPRYSGLLAAAPTAVGDVRDIAGRLDLYSRQLGRITTGVSQLYAVTSNLPTFTPGDDTIRLLHVSDLHLSPSAYSVIRSVVKQFDVDAVLDTGDINDFGTEAETRYLDGIRSIGVPYVYVRGNHDSKRTEQAVRDRGAVVLDGDQVVEVAGVRLLGSPDPRFTPDDATRGDREPPEVLLAQGRLLADAVRLAPVEPDLVMLHDPIAAEPLRGVTPLVLAGHKHKRKATTVDGTLLLVEGSTGGAGIRGLEGEEPTPVELSVLYLDRKTHRLQAYDEITLGGLGTTSARIERTAVAPVVPSPTPSGSLTPSAGSASPTPAPAPGPSPTR
ncbi:MAG: rane protein [Frankiales bacterium]|nr:rane protein [Frankiales bacterium]